MTLREFEPYENYFPVLRTGTKKSAEHEASKLRKQGYAAAVARNWSARESTLRWEVQRSEHKRKPVDASKEAKADILREKAQKILGPYYAFYDQREFYKSGKKTRKGTFAKKKATCTVSAVRTHKSKRKSCKRK